MTREEAINKVRWVLFGLVVDKDVHDAFEMLIPELHESEDERIRKAIVNHFKNHKEDSWINLEIPAILAWLEKQKYDRMKPIYDARESFESALEKAWNDYHNGYENVDKLEDDYVECAHAKGFREGYLFGIEKQKDASKAIDAVERIDKYIDEHVANAHDMKDSNPDKKYYRGWDDALGKMSGILQDVYSNEQKKESLHIPETCKENTDSFTDEDEKIRIELLKDIPKVFPYEKAFRYIHWLEKQKEQKPSFDVKQFDLTDFEEELVLLLRGARELNVSDDEIVRNVKSQIAPNLLVFMEKEQKPTNDGKKWIFEDDYQRDLERHRQEGYEEGYEKGLKEQKPVEWSEPKIDGNPIPTENQTVDISPVEWTKEDEDMLLSTIEYVQTYPAHRQSVVNWLNNRFKLLHSQPCNAVKHDIAIQFIHFLDENRPEGKMCLSNAECEDIDKAFKENDWAKIMRYVEKYHSQPAEWSEEDKKLIDDVINSLCCYQNTLSYYQKEIVGEEIRKLKSLRPQKKVEWDEEDKKMIKWLISYFEQDNVLYAKTISWLKSLPERLNLQLKQGWSEEDDKTWTEILEFIERRKNQFPLARIYTKWVAWLKSLRPSWKPSEEQIEALVRATDHCRSQAKLGYYITVEDIPLLEQFHERLKKM